MGCFISLKQDCLLVSVKLHEYMILSLRTEEKHIAKNFVYILDAYSSSYLNYCLLTHQLMCTGILQQTQIYSQSAIKHIKRILGSSIVSVLFQDVNLNRNLLQSLLY